MSATSPARGGDRQTVLALAGCSLDRSPGTNWVEKAGGLPEYICKIAEDIHQERGMTISHAIAIAVEQVRRWASGEGNVSAATRAKAAKALAEWEAKRVKTHARTAAKVAASRPADGLDRILATTEHTTPLDRVLALATPAPDKATPSAAQMVHRGADMVHEGARMAEQAASMLAAGDTEAGHAMMARGRAMMAQGRAMMHRARAMTGGADATVAASAAALAADKPYGDVPYADPGYQDDGKKRYPIDNPDHVRAAWSYVNQADNAKRYTADQLARVKARITAAARRLGVKISDPAA